MAFTYVDSATSTFTAQNGAGIPPNPYTVSVTIPATIQAGDFLFFHVALSNVTAPSGYTGPTGWYLITSGTQTNLLAHLYFKVATNADASSSVGMYWASGTTRTGALMVAAYRGAIVDGTYAGGANLSSLTGPLNASMDFQGTTNTQTSTATFTLTEVATNKNYMNYRNLRQVALFACNSAVTYSSSVTMTHRASVSNTVSLHLLDTTHDRFPTQTLTDQTVTFSGATTARAPHFFFVDSLLTSEFSYISGLNAKIEGGIQQAPVSYLRNPPIDSADQVAGIAYSRDHSGAFGVWSTHRKLYDVREG